MANRKFNGRVVITRKSVKGENSQAAKVARFDMQKEGTKLLSEDQVFTQEELDGLYAKDDPDEPYWCKY
jgi:hypothetical protein